MEKWFIANFKMSKEMDSLKKVKKYAKTFAEFKLPAEGNIAICPNFLFVSTLVNAFKNTPVLVGAQNCADKQDGAFTGEVSASMLKNCGASVVILGHSERRRYYGETDEVINQKTMLALQNNLIPVICLSFDDMKDYKKNLNAQLKILLDGVKDNGTVVLALEPTSSIGTGKTMAVEDLNQVISFIKECAFKFLDSNVPVLYGGSVKPENAKQFITDANADGLLVGGASLNPEKFMAICNCLNT